MELNYTEFEQFDITATVSDRLPVPYLTEMLAIVSVGNREP